VEIFTKVFWPTGPGARPRAVPQDITESAHASLAPPADRLLDLYQAHRYDYGTPLAETMRAFDDLVRQGKCCMSESRSGGPIRIAEALRSPTKWGSTGSSRTRRSTHDLGGHRVRGSSRLCEQEGSAKVVFLADRQGVAHRKYRPGQPAAGRVTGDRPERVRVIQRSLTDGAADRVQELRPLADEAGLSLAQLASPGAAERTCPRRSSALPGRRQVRENVKASGVRLDPGLLADRRCARPEIQRDPALTQSPPA